MAGRLLSKLSAFEQSVYKQIWESQDGTTDQDGLEQGMGLGVADRERLAEAVNRLARRYLIEFKTENGHVLLKAVEQNEAQIRKELTPDEGLVYDIIKDAGNQGLWTRTLQKRSNLHPANITKALKSLQTKKLVKSVHSVKAKTKKLYMLYGLQPGVEITGGPWYTDHEFDVGFIDVVRRLSLDIIAKRARLARPEYPTVDDIWSAIAAAGVIQEELEKEHVQQILDTLIYDGQIQALRTQKGDVYQLSKEIGLTAKLGSPCTTCPVFDECQPGGLINPSDCPYFDSWLSDPA